MNVVLTVGTRAEPAEELLTEDVDAKDLYAVFIDGKRHFFASPLAYYKWAGKSLVRPLASSLIKLLPKNLHDQESSQSDSESELEWGDEWGDADDQDWASEETTPR